MQTELLATASKGVILQKNLPLPDLSFTFVPPPPLTPPLTTPYKVRVWEQGVKQLRALDLESELSLATYLLGTGHSFIHSFTCSFICFLSLIHSRIHLVSHHSIAHLPPHPITLGQVHPCFCPTPNPSKFSVGKLFGSSKPISSSFGCSKDKEIM